MNAAQIRKRLDVDRDAALKTAIADRFAADADRKFLAGDMEGSRQLRETAAWLRTASRAQARKFLGTVYNAMQEADRA